MCPHIHAVIGHHLGWQRGPPSHRSCSSHPSCTGLLNSSLICLCRWSPGPQQERGTLLQVLEAASQGAHARVNGNNVASLSLRGRGDVDDEMVLHACQLFPCLRCWLHFLS